MLNELKIDRGLRWAGILVHDQLRYYRGTDTVVTFVVPLQNKHRDKLQINARHYTRELRQVSSSYGLLLRGPFE